MPDFRVLQYPADLVLFEKKPQYVYDRNCKIIKLFILGHGRAIFFLARVGLGLALFALEPVWIANFLTIIQLKMPFFVLAGLGHSKSGPG